MDLAGSGVNSANWPALILVHGNDWIMQTIWPLHDKDRSIWILTIDIHFNILKLQWGIRKSSRLNFDANPLASYLRLKFKSGYAVRSISLL